MLSSFEISALFILYIIMTSELFYHLTEDLPQCNYSFYYFLLKSTSIFHPNSDFILYVANHILPYPFAKWLAFGFHSPSLDKLPGFWSVYHTLLE